MPYIPPEIWRYILEWATFVPGSLDPDTEDPFDAVEPRRWHNRLTKQGIREEQDRVRTSLVTKRYIVRVSKQWHDLGMPMLYRSIFIGKERILDSLYQQLQRSHERKREIGPDSQSLGWHTLRLDFRMHDVTPSGSLDEQNRSILLNIFSLLPCLSIVVISSVHGEPSYPGILHGLSQDVAKACGSTIQMIVWAYAQGWDRRRTRNRQSAELTTKVLPHLPALRTLHSDFTFMDDFSQVASTSSPHVKFLTANFLHHIDLVNALTNTTPVFPALRQFCSRADFPEGWNPSRSPFLAAHGAQLTTLYLHCDETPTINGRFFHLSSMSSQYCPRLIHLVLIFSQWSVLRGLRVPPQVTHLGLLCITSQSVAYIYDELFKTLYDTMIPPTPSLRVIRFLNPQATKNMRDRHRKVLLLGLRRLAPYDLRVEDHEGQDMRELSF